MNDVKYLILTYYKNAYFFPYLKTNNIVVSEPIRNKSAIMRLLFRIPFLCLLSYAFYKELKNADKVIIFDGAYNKWLGLFLKYRKKKNVFLYFWNPIKKMYPRNGDKIVEQAKKIMPVYSFDHKDCEMYGLEYRSMVYSSDVFSVIGENDKPEYDIFFLGWKKDRGEQIEFLYNKFFKGKLRCKFILVGNENKVIDDGLIYTTQKVPYSRYLEFIRNSRTVLDVPQIGQEGLTIRNVECLFLRKKMITTNANVKNYDLFNPNIFILSDEISENDIDLFISKNYECVSDSVINKYDFAKWVDSFVEK